MKLHPILILIGSLVIASCGGGGELVAGIDSRGNPAPSAGIVAKGSITGFGSVIVNGVTYDTSSATFTIDGNLGTQADLAVGDVVIIVGTAGDSGTPVASSVTFDDVVEGPVSDIDLAAETLTVLGQLVRIDPATSFDDGIVPRSIDGVDIDDVLEVSGFLLADGSISATRIERKTPGGELELTGIVSNVGGDTFEVNGFVVDFSGAMLEGFPGGAPENGQRVEAKGDSPLGGSGELVATRVEFKGGEFGEDGDDAEVEGFITVFNSTADFEVEGVRVATNAQTTYTNGTSADLALNRKLEVEGSINASGVLIADSIEFRASGVLRVEAQVEDVQAGQLTLLGISIRVDDATRYEDSLLDLENFGFSDISVGEYLEIRGYGDQNDFVATQIERDEFRGDVAVRGFVESVADPDFVILGVTISTSGATTFTDNDGVTDLMPADFFGQANGRLVEASGSLNGAIINADEVEFED